MDRRILAAVSSVFVAGLGASAALAAPYASAVSESGGNVSFRLNESADEVIVIRDGTATSLGALGLGSHSFARNGATNYSIVVRKSAGPGYLTMQSPNVGTPLQISDDNNPLVSFFSPRGVVVNQNPANGALFGRIYVSEATGGTTGGFPTPVRSLTEGIFLLNPDLTDAVGQGDTGRTAGIDFGTGGASSPFRIALDESGALYISDWADATGTVYRTDANVTTGGNLLAGQGSPSPIAPSAALNHGSVGGLALTGSLAGGNLTLYTVDEDLSPDGTANQLNSAWRYDINAGPTPYTQNPTQLARDLLIGTLSTGGIYVDLARGKDGKIYLSQTRADGNEPGVFVTSSDGTTPIYNSLADSQARGIDGNPALDGIQDVLRQTRGIDVSPDGRFLAVQATNSDVMIVPLLAGVPDLVNRIALDTFDDVTIGREVAFDAAGNLYTVSSGNEALRIFSPGGVSLTSYNSNGTFFMDPTYTGGAGNYSNADAWLGGVVPNGANQVANFGGTGGAVTVDSPVTLGAVKFDSASSYTLGGSSTITLQGASPSVTSLRGNHTVSAPVRLDQSTGLVANGGTLTISNLNVNPAAVNPVEVYTGGTGVVQVNRVGAQRLFVTSGTTRILPGGTSASTSNVRQLDIAGGATPVAKLDVTNNAFVVDYSGISPHDTIKAQITSAYANGAWTGNGITSSQANNSTHAVGYSEASQLTSVPAIFGTVDASAVLFRYTRYGDANLDGQVNLADFNRLASNFGSTSAVWNQGDFNYDNNVNLADFNRLASNFGLSAAGPEVTPEDWSALAAAVPEPSGLALVGVALLGAARRRRRA